MARAVVTVTSIAGLGSLLSSIAAPEMIEGLPDWVATTLFACGMALLVVAAAWHLLHRKGTAGETGATTQASHGPHSPNVGTVHGDVYFGPPAPPIQERKQTTAPRSEYKIGQLTEGLERALRDVGLDTDKHSSFVRRVNRRVAEEMQRCPKEPIWKAVQQVATAIGDTDDQHCYPEARCQIRQAALEGRLDVWGQKDRPPRHMKDEGHSAVWTRIDPDYWHDYELNPLATGELFDEREHTWNEELCSLRGNRYWSLRVRQQEIDHYWPLKGA